MNNYLYTNVNRIDILPALPEKWKSGKIWPLRTRYATEVNSEWENNAVTVEIRALSNTKIDLYMPDGSREHIMMQRGQSTVRKSSIKM